ncbi:MAG: hypothetical protein SNJ64_01880 [Endomicrobiia bacterium]
MRQIKWEKFNKKETKPSNRLVINLNFSDFNSSLLPDFYILHTNFNITRHIINILNNIPGIESLEVFTRYRCRVGIAKLFDPLEVISEVERILLQNPTNNNGNIEKILQQTRNYLASKYNYWAIEYDNGRINPIGGNTKEEVMSKVKQKKVEFSWQTNHDK